MVILSRKCGGMLQFTGLNTLADAERTIGTDKFREKEKDMISGQRVGLRRDGMEGLH